jgi:hypothetical protein
MRKTLREVMALVEAEERIWRARGFGRCPHCNAIGGNNNPAHVCPKSHPCRDCGKSAEVFICAEEFQALQSPRGLETAVAAPNGTQERRSPICDHCLYNRLSAQQKRMS